jgi:hypothetical protein
LLSYISDLKFGIRVDPWNCMALSGDTRFQTASNLILCVYEDGVFDVNAGLDNVQTLLKTNVSMYTKPVSFPSLYLFPQEEC